MQNHQNQVSKCPLFIIHSTDSTDFKPTVQKGLWRSLPSIPFLSNRALRISIKFLTGSTVTAFISLVGNLRKKAESHGGCLPVTCVRSHRVSHGEGHIMGKQLTPRLERSLQAFPSWPLKTWGNFMITHSTSYVHFDVHWVK